MHAIRLHRSFAAWQCAIDTPKASDALDLIERAISDGVFWVEQHPNDQYARAILVQTYLTKANILEELKRDTEHLQSLEDAESEVAKLDEIPTQMEPIFARFLYLQHRGEYDLADKFLLQCLKTAEDAVDYVAAYCGIIGFKLGDIEITRKALDRMTPAERRLKESSRFLTELGTNPPPETRRDLLIGFRTYLVGKGNTGDYTQFEQDWLVIGLLGDFERARRHALEAGAYFGDFANSQQRDLGPISDYLADVTNDPDLLIKKCRHSRRTLVSAYFAIAIKALAEGDHTAALSYFQECVDQNVYQFYVHQWSLALIEKLKLDPEWPAWILRDSE